MPLHSAVLASMLLGDELNLLGKVGCVLCMIGSTVIVLNAPEEAEITSVDQITEKMATNIGTTLIEIQNETKAKRDGSIQAR